MSSADGARIKMIRDAIPVLVLQRGPGGAWTKEQEKRLVENFGSRAFRDPKHEAFLVLICGSHYTTSTTIAMVVGDHAFSVESFVGLNDPRMPFPIPWPNDN